MRSRWGGRRETHAAVNCRRAHGIGENCDLVLTVRGAGIEAVRCYARVVG